MIMGSKYLTPLFLRGIIEGRYYVYEEVPVKLNQIGSEIQEKKMNQVGLEMQFPSFFAYVPWKHHVLIIQKCKTIQEALFYIKRTVDENLSRNALDNCIRADMYHVMVGLLLVGKRKLSFQEKPEKSICFFIIFI